MADSASKPVKKAPTQGETAPAPKGEDVALVCGASPDGESLGVLRKRGERVEAAIMQKAVEGRPVHGELVRLKPRQEPLLFDVETLHAPSGEGERSGRPAQVASDRYRRGWDRLFARKRRSRQLN